ncbi:MAG: FapA family protein [Candidatus Cloacimonetes bacterium]|nr:FapA family protein [Candidatus Cloacimonadota bacterium]
MENQTIGNLDIRAVENGLSLQISRMYSILENGEEVSFETIKDQITHTYHKVELNEKLIKWYIEKSPKSEIPLTNIVIAVGRAPISVGSHILNFSHEHFSADDLVFWDFVKIFFNNINENDLNQKLPFPLYYVKKGEIIATQKNATSEIAGKELNGDIIPVDRNKQKRYFAGDNVYFEESEKTYIATCSGYVYMNNNKICIQQPFFVSKDRLTLYFMNFERLPFQHLTKIDISTYILKNKIDMKLVNKEMNLMIPPGEPIALVLGKQPEESIDSSIEILVETEMKQSPIDENGRVDYREINQFPSVSKDELLARKKMPIRGKDGVDIYGNSIAPRTPKDIMLKNGYHTYTKLKDDILSIYSSDDGRIEYKNGILSVFDQLQISGDIDYSSGNINTKVNVHINGSVRTGFSIKTEKSVFIKGTVEDNCVIEAGGDLVVNGGIAGQMNNITVQGNMSVKFIEGGNVFVKGHLTVHRFLMGVKIHCQDTISVMGAGINLNEKGAIIDCEIYLKGLLYCPTIGNDVGQETYIHFGYDKVLNGKIKNLEEAIHKNKQSVDELSNKLGIDITQPNIHGVIKEFTRDRKDQVIAAIQQKNKFDKQYKMISEILEKEMEKKKENLTKSAIFVTNKVFPPLNLECDNTKKIIDSLQPPSKYFYNYETKWIERDRFLNEIK